MPRFGKLRSAPRNFIFLTRSGYTPISFNSIEPAQFVVLLVDDEPVVRNFVQYALTRYGFNVLAACDGIEALELSRRYDGAIHLLLSDVKMPRMNGPQLAEVISNERPDARILLMSGESSGELPENLRIDLLRKPFVPKTLLDRICAALESFHGDDRNNQPPPSSGPSEVRS